MLTLIDREGSEIILATINYPMYKYHRAYFCELHALLSEYIRSEVQRLVRQRTLTNHRNCIVENYQIQNGNYEDRMWF